MTSTDQLVTITPTHGPSLRVEPGHRAPAHRPAGAAAAAGCGRPLEDTRKPHGAAAHNPVRISQIGSDRLQVFVRSVDSCGELVALVDRLERLIGAGYDVIDVVLEPARRPGPAGDGVPVPAQPDALRVLRTRG